MRVKNSNTWRSAQIWIWMPKGQQTIPLKSWNSRAGPRSANNDNGAVAEVWGAKADTRSKRVNRKWNTGRQTMKGCAWLATDDSSGANGQADKWTTGEPESGLKYLLPRTGARAETEAAAGAGPVPGLLLGSSLFTACALHLTEMNCSCPCFCSSSSRVEAC